MVNWRGLKYTHVIRCMKRRTFSLSLYLAYIYLRYSITFLIEKAYQRMRLSQSSDYDFSESRTKNIYNLG